MSLYGMYHKGNRFDNLVIVYHIGNFQETLHHYNHKKYVLKNCFCTIIVVLTKFISALPRRYQFTNSVYTRTSIFMRRYVSSCAT